MNPGISYQQCAADSRPDPIGGSRWLKPAGLLLPLAFIFTLVYIVLSFLSPATLFPQLAQRGLMVWISGAAALMCLYPLLSHRTLWRSPYPYLMFGLMACVAVSRVPTSGVVAALREFLASAIVFFLAIAVLDKISKVRVLAFVVALSAVFLLTQCFYNWDGHDVHGPHVFWQNVDDSHGRLIRVFPRIESVGFLADANDFAQFLLVSVSLLVLAWKPRSAARNVILVVLPILYLLYGVHATYSRGGMIGLAVVTFFLSNLKFSKGVSLILAGAVLRGVPSDVPAGPQSSDPA